MQNNKKTKNKGFIVTVNGYYKGVFITYSDAYKFVKNLRCDLDDVIQIYSLEEKIAVDSFYIL